MTMFVIEHDNGIRGQHGFSDYTMSEVWAKGGINAIIAEMKAHGITVYEWFKCEQ